MEGDRTAGRGQKAGGYPVVGMTIGLVFGN